MEQEIKQLQFPIKTKIAAWWMKMMWIASPLLILVSVLMISGKSVGLSAQAFYLGLTAGPFLFPLFCIFFFLGHYVLKRKRKAWLLSIYLLSILVAFLIIILGGAYYSSPGHCFSPGADSPLCFSASVSTLGILLFLLMYLFILILFLVPLALLLLDRKNFFKVVL